MERVCYAEDALEVEVEAVFCFISIWFDVKTKI